MDVNELLLLDAEEIEYSSLSDEILYKLVMRDEEPYISTNALSELSIRNSKLANDAALEIWNRCLGDKFLRAQSLKVIYENDKEKALDYFNKFFPGVDMPILEAMIDIVMMDAEYFKSKNNLKAFICLLFEEVNARKNEYYYDPEQRDDFLKSMRGVVGNK